MSVPQELMTRARREALAHLSEECCEVAIAVAKALRHGLGSVNPDDPSGPDNLEAIADELGDVLGAMDVFLHNIDTDPRATLWMRKRVLAARWQKLEKVQQYLHCAVAPTPDQVRGWAGSAS